MPRRGDGDDWIDEVADALADLGLFDEDTRAALVESVREAVEASPELPDADDEAGRPAVTVIPGGRGADEAPTSGHPPTLRVVEGSGPPDDADPVAVRVLRLGRASAEGGPRGRGQPAPAVAEGRIAVRGGDDVWQTITYGPRPRAYRLHCESGELHIAADGDLVVRLLIGQSCDVEGSVIRVRAGETSGATGRFVRVGASG